MSALQIQYHEDFEKSKGKVTQVADTVEMQRHTENTKNFSLVLTCASCDFVVHTYTKYMFGACESLPLTRNADWFGFETVICLTYFAVRFIQCVFTSYS